VSSSRSRRQVTRRAIESCRGGADRRAASPDDSPRRSVPAPPPAACTVDTDALTVQKLVPTELGGRARAGDADLSASAF